MKKESRGRAGTKQTSKSVPEVMHIAQVYCRPPSCSKEETLVASQFRCRSRCRLSATRTPATVSRWWRRESAFILFVPVSVACLRYGTGDWHSRWGSCWDSWRCCRSIGVPIVASRFRFQRSVSSYLSLHIQVLDWPTDSLEWPESLLSLELTLVKVYLALPELNQVVVNNVLDIERCKELVIDKWTAISSFLFAQPGSGVSNNTHREDEEGVFGDVGGQLGYISKLFCLRVLLWKTHFDRLFLENENFFKKLALLKVINVHDVGCGPGVAALGMLYSLCQKKNTHGKYLFNTSKFSFTFTDLYGTWYLLLLHRNHCSESHIAGNMRSISCHWKSCLLFRTSDLRRGEKNPTLIPIWLFLATSSMSRWAITRILILYYLLIIGERHHQN